MVTLHYTADHRYCAEGYANLVLWMISVNPTLLSSQISHQSVIHRMIAMRSLAWMSRADDSMYVSEVYDQ